MTMGGCAQNARGEYVILGTGAFPPPVILRSEGDEESLGHALGREGRFFAALRMTMGECAQNDNGGVCHSGERRFPALSF